MNAFGIDVSAYNGQVDWGKAKARDVSFAGMRAAISWGYRDKWLAHNLAGTKEQNIERMAYHVLYPGENITKQAENFAAAVGDWSDVQPVMDVELDHGLGNSQITAAIVLMIAEINRIIGKNPIIYSRANWIKSFTLPGEWRQSVPWWLAQYNFDRTRERITPPDLPFGVTNFLIHQNADKYPQFCNGADGIATVDINRWNGSEADMRAWFHPTPPEPPSKYQIISRLKEVGELAAVVAQLEKRMDSLDPVNPPGATI